ncbi:hypothetical protein E2C01_020043 [Portunus trituberculatus]|uniref:Secreted protein n=1 Tax=Portunus trituberculatus TaxID=210409 RepID=A0A5B7E114_PORTR|nr:hypothetical protein [Portunus trituberculatus]
MVICRSLLRLMATSVVHSRATSWSSRRRSTVDGDSLPSPPSTVTSTSLWKNSYTSKNFVQGF